MNFAELVYKLHEFYFTDIWHFCGLLILILALRGDVSRGLNAVGRFFRNVKLRYKERIRKINAYEDVKKNVSKDAKKFANINTEKEV